MHLFLPLLCLLASTAPLTQDHLQENSFKDSWANSPERPWPGRDWHANRAQDWHITGQWLNCLTGENSTAGRTVHLLTQRVEQGEEAVTVNVTVKPTTPGEMSEGACFGFLIGMGDEKTDYRATALVQQAPAKGGGLLVSLDASGTLSLKDFSTPLTEGGYWTIPGNLDFRKLPDIAKAPHTLPINDHPIKLQLHWKHDELTIKAISKDKNGKTEISFVDLKSWLYGTKI